MQLSAIMFESGLNKIVLSEDRTDIAKKKFKMEQLRLFTCCYNLLHLYVLIIYRPLFVMCSLKGSHKSWGILMYISIGIYRGLVITNSTAVQWCWLKWVSDNQKTLVGDRYGGRATLPPPPLHLAFLLLLSTCKQQSEAVEYIYYIIWLLILFFPLSPSFAKFVVHLTGDQISQFTSLTN